MALTKVINDLADLNQSGTTNALKGCAGTTAQQPQNRTDRERTLEWTSHIVRNRAQLVFLEAWCAHKSNE